MLVAHILHTVKMKVAQLCQTLCDPMDSSPPDSSVLGILQARILEWVAISFPRGFNPSQGWNPGLPDCRWTLYHLSHQGSPRILEWAAFPFSRGSSRCRDHTQVSGAAGRFLPAEAPGRPLLHKRFAAAFNASWSLLPFPSPYWSTTSFFCVIYEPASVLL